MLTCLDDAVGNVSGALQRAGVWKESLVVFTNDNGAATPACGGATGAQNWPLRGGKCSAWEVSDSEYINDVPCSPPPIITGPDPAEL
jgi:arylsulfatase A-like enzyme